MSITGPGSITAANIQAVNNMNNQLSTLSEELGTGQAAQTYSGLGSQAGLALSLNQQLAAITAYGNTATTVGTTLTVAQSVLSQLDGSRNSVIQAVGQQGTFALNGNGQTQTQAAAVSQLGEILSLLNTQVGNNYIFSGSATTTPSVASSNEILNGNGAQAGLVQVIAEREQADLGTGSGRLVVGGSGSSVSLADDSATSPFGFKVASITSNLTGATVTSSSPPSVAVNLGANPNAGDTIAFGLTLPDGSSQTITLQATTDSPPGANQFTIGANANATAANLQTALSSAVSSLAQTALPAASAMARSCLPCLSKTSRPGDGDASTTVRPSPPCLTVRNPGPTAGKSLLFAVSSPSPWANTLLAARDASRHKIAAMLDIRAFFCCMSPQITVGRCSAAPRCSPDQAPGRVAARPWDS